jgi:hypothetical protein
MREGFRQTREAISDVVNIVGDKIDQLEKTIYDMQGATAQNSYELQVLKSKAQ